MKKVLLLTLALFITVSVVVILGNVITIGEKFTTVFGVPYVEYVFYFLLASLFAYLLYDAILEPMMLSISPWLATPSMKRRENCSKQIQI